MSDFIKKDFEKNLSLNIENICTEILNKKIRSLKQILSGSKKCERDTILFPEYQYLACLNERLYEPGPSEQLL